MKNRTRALALAGSAALLGTLMAAAPAPAAPAAPKTASVHGGGTVRYPYAPASDDIRFTVDAESVPWSRPLKGQNLEQGLPTDARGRVTVYHAMPDRDFTAVAEAEVDCMVTGGRTATVTAVVTSSNIGLVGQRIGLSVQDGERGAPDRVGFSWGHRERRREAGRHGRRTDGGHLHGPGAVHRGHQGRLQGHPGPAGTAAHAAAVVTAPQPKRWSRRRRLQVPGLNGGGPVPRAPRRHHLGDAQPYTRRSSAIGTPSGPPTARWTLPSRARIRSRIQGGGTPRPRSHAWKT